MQINYVKIIDKFYPDIECYSVGPNYSNIVWVTGGPIAQGTLDQKHLEFVIWEAEEIVKSKASKQRDLVYSIVLGTDDPSLVRVYEEKEKQARYYLEKINASETPEANRIYLLENEAVNLGLTKDTLANAIILQADHANSQIMPMLGEIEGKRRAIQLQIAACQTDTEVESIVNTPIIWPDTSNLVII